MKAVGMSGSRNASRIAGILPFVRGEGNAAKWVLFAGSDPGMERGFPRVSRSRKVLWQHILSSSRAAWDFQGVPEPGSAPLAPGESILRRVHQTQPPENLALIRRQLYSGHKSLSSGKRGETRISRLPNRE